MWDGAISEAGRDGQARSEEAALGRPGDSGAELHKRNEEERGSEHQGCWRVRAEGRYLSA